jgi:acid phosphatase
MKPSRLPFLLLQVSLLAIFSAAQSASADHTPLPEEPTPNLGQLKIQLIAYHDCTGKYKDEGKCYTNEVDRQAERAIEYLQQRTVRRKPDEKLALVLDVDETALSNWDEEKQDDFGYIPADWNAWVAKKQAPAIEGTLRLYRKAIEQKVHVFFVTSRSTDQGFETADNLNAVGYDQWDGLALRGPHPKMQTVTDFKSGERRKIAEAGYKIILNVGDQMSDLNGEPQAELSIKLPNPFYYIP